jgi:hypothetical protein
MLKRRFMNSFWHEVWVYLGTFAVIAGCMVLAGCSISFAGEKPAERWEHGWKTERVIATRYKNASVGYNIGFKFPRNPDDCDVVELSEFMEAHNGTVYQSGGYPGAEMFVIFSDVKDVPSADKKLQVILPSLNKLVASF